MKKEIGGWGIDKRISLTNLAQLVAIVIAGVTFYNQVNNNQQRNEERFAAFSDQRKLQAEQMIEMQKGQNEVLLKLSTLTERMNYTTDAIKDLNSTIKLKNIK